MCWAPARETLPGTPHVANLSLIVDNTAPTVAITNPASGAVVAGNVSLTSTASDATSGVTKVQYFVDDISVGLSITGPAYSINWDSTTVANGSPHGDGACYGFAGQHEDLSGSYGQRYECHSSSGYRHYNDRQSEPGVDGWNDQLLSSSD
jgi:hypothetical protein